MKIFQRFRAWIVQKQIEFVLHRLRGKSVLMTQVTNKNTTIYHFNYEDEYGTPHYISIEHKRKT